MESPNFHLYDDNVFAAVGDYVAREAMYWMSEGEDEEEDDDDDEDDDEEYVPAMASPRVSQHPRPNSIATDFIVMCDGPQNSAEEDGNKRRRTQEGEPSCSLGSQGNELNSSNIDGLFCPICMDAWTNNGEHHICCLPCGHLYGMSCIKRWLQQQKNSGKCPQCNMKCSLKDVRKLYASRLVAVDGESQKRIRSLESKCAALESQGREWIKKEAGWKKRDAALLLDVQQLTERNTYLEQLLLDMQSRQSGLMYGNVNSQRRYETEHNFGPKSDGKGSFCNFELQNAFNLDAARVFDIDPSKPIILIAQKSRKIGGTHSHFLSKMSLMSPFEMEDIILPSTTTGVRDLHISPSSSLALYASFGRKLSVLSLDSNNLVLSYDLEVPAWSCSWDLNSSHHMYAGLLDGSVLVFDMRQTAGPMKSLVGLTSNPVHTVQSLSQTSSLPAGVKTILSASAIGLCQWNIDSEERPLMVPETDKQGVCISFASCSSSDDIVVSYRPKFDMYADMPLSQLSPTSSQVIGQGVQGSHVSFKRLGGHHFQKMGSSYANVNKIRLPKCVIIDENQSRLFAAGDEVTCELVLHELPSFRVLQQFKMPAQARDVRYSPSHGILGCLSENSLQLLHAKHS